MMKLSANTLLCIVLLLSIITGTDCAMPLTRIARKLAERFASEMGSIQGVVKTKANGSPLPNVLIKLHDGSGKTVILTTETDSTGSYVFSDLKPQLYRVHSAVDKNVLKSMSPTIKIMSLKKGQTMVTTDFLCEKLLTTDDVQKKGYAAEKKELKKQAVEAESSKLPGLMTTNCNHYARDQCLLGGDPEEHGRCTPESKYLGICGATEFGWAVKYLDHYYDEDTDETVATYQVSEGPSHASINHVAFSWTGNCCLKSTEYAGPVVTSGVDSSTCSFGPVFVHEGNNEKHTHVLRFAGKPQMVDDALQVSVKGNMGERYGGQGFCKHFVKGPDCSSCPTGVSS